MKKKIGIIGAGISGLLACKHAMEKGFSPIVFEARSDLGGVWNQTIESTKLQSPKFYYQFSDFPWPDSVTETFPDHNQVLAYVRAYAQRFNILPRIQFNTRVLSIDYVNSESDYEEMIGWEAWGGSGYALSPAGKWNVSFQDSRDPSSPVEVYQMDFVIICIGRYSDLRNLPEFPVNKGPEVFSGEVLHAQDYAAMDDDRAADFVKDKRVTIVGFQKSAVDLANEVANRNGVEHPCTMVFRTVHWLVPESLLLVILKGLNRFAELFIHKPAEGFFSWLLAFLLSPMLWIISTLIEIYLKWKFPLKKLNLIPVHGVFKQIYRCMFTILPRNFFKNVENGSILLRKSNNFTFCKNGVILDGEEDKPIQSDIVIFATGYRSDDKIKNIFKSTYFQKCIIGSSAPFFRDCIHPRIPQLAILGYVVSPSILFTTETRSIWVAHFIAGKFKLPSIKEMEKEAIEWEKCARKYSGERYKRSCVSIMLQIYSNDLLCKDMGYNPRRKKNFLKELFDQYTPNDYKYLKV
ncbi:probable flavin-containing monooxygenase 1 [Euphorbia lathyris]|uniref:probable flavin-containing monooxygenase 1 n=1 Tax=Euphorbia lathyris TaxID=212925 RepID=UPI0033138373